MHRTSRTHPYRKLNAKHTSLPSSCVCIGQPCGSIRGPEATRLLWSFSMHTTHPTARSCSSFFSTLPRPVGGQPTWLPLVPGWVKGPHRCKRTPNARGVERRYGLVREADYGCPVSQASCIVGDNDAAAVPPLHGLECRSRTRALSGPALTDTSCCDANPPHRGK